jgi:hypothetical protein
MQSVILFSLLLLALPATAQQATNLLWTNAVTIGWTVNTATNIASQTVIQSSPTWTNVLTLSPASYRHSFKGLSWDTTFAFTIACTDLNNQSSTNPVPLLIRTPSAP